MTSQKQDMTELKLVCPVLMTGEWPMSVLKLFQALQVFVLFETITLEIHFGVLCFESYHHIPYHILYLSTNFHILTSLPGIWYPRNVAYFSFIQHFKISGSWEIDYRHIHTSLSGYGISWPLSFLSLSRMNTLLKMEGL